MKDRHWLQIAAVIVIVVVGNLYFDRPRDVRAAPATVESLKEHRGYIRVFTDPETRCEYLVDAERGGITPRRSATGGHICGRS